MTRAALLLAAALATGGACPADPGRTRAQSRFPQPIAAGALLGRTVLQPLESQPVLGQVQAVVQRPGGTDVIVALGGVLARFGGIGGLGARPVAVPLTAMTLLGADMEIVDLSPEQLAALPSYTGGALPLAPGAPLCVGLSRPSH